MRTNKTIKTASLLRKIWNTFNDTQSLAPDEFMVFVWLFQESGKHLYKEFPASIPNMQNTIRIGRTRQETILKTFESQGWLHIGKMINEYGVPYRSFFLDIKSLSDKSVLSHLFAPESKTFSELLELFKEQAKVI